MRKEVREAALDWMDAHDGAPLSYPEETAKAMRGGEDTIHSDTCGLVAAMLDVFEGYEAVEAGPWDDRTSHALLLPTDGAFGLRVSEHSGPHFTIYIKKKKPKPDLKELARRASKAYHAWMIEPGNLAVAMAAMDAELDKD